MSAASAQMCQHTCQPCQHCQGKRPQCKYVNTAPINSSIATIHGSRASPKKTEPDLHSQPTLAPHYSANLGQPGSHIPDSVPGIAYGPGST
eukprot:936754-Rhodomonas_salina.6